MKKTNRAPIIILMGATCSGKSEIAMETAAKFPSEIISADSMQLYKGMDIGTAKPSEKDQMAVSHHLIDTLDISQKSEVYSYVTLADAAIKDISSRGRTPIIAGGSGLYIKALLYGLDPLPSDKELSDALYAKFYNNTPALIEELSKIDKEAVEAFYTKPRKMIRALEVFTLTGSSILKQNNQWNRNALKYNAFSCIIRRERADLYNRIALRTNQMLSEGWIEETMELMKKGLSESPTAKQAIGYGHIMNYISNKMTFDEMKMRIIADTKKYARRQETWFKHQHPEASLFTLPKDKEVLSDGIYKSLHT